MLDLDGDGVELISLADSQAHFDYAGDGFREKTGWLNSNDAFLVHDDNGDGIVSGIAELFGSPEEDGFTALRAFDSNGDGKVDANDEQFSSLKLWRDLNGDGAFDDGEMFSLSEYDIQSVNVTGTASGRIDEGNSIAFEGIFTRSDGSIGTAEAVLFSTNVTISRWDPPEGFDVPDNVDILPNLRGYGLIPDLAYAMTLDEDLRSLVESYVIDSMMASAGDLREGFENLLFNWAGVTEVSSNSRGSYINGKEVAFLEKYFGSALVGNSDGTIGSRFAAVIADSFDTVANVLLTRFLSQTVSSAVSLGIDLNVILDSPFLPLALLDYDHESDGFQNDIGMVVEWMIELAPAQGEAKLPYFAKMVTGLVGLEYEYFGGDKSALSAFVRSKLLESGFEDKGIVTFVEAYFQSGVLHEGTIGADTLSGNGTGEVFIGGRGNDVVNGGKANDTYAYARGDGNDTITEDVWGGTNDQLVLSGINSGDVTLVRNGNDVTLVIAESTPGAGDGGSTFLKASLDDNNETGLERIVFADGTTWTKANLRLMLLGQATTAGNDTITGFNVADVIDARAGNDTINAGDGADTITGGLGNDVINGGKANDTYYYNRGDGNDTIADDVWGGTSDQLVLSGINSGDVTLVRNGNDVTLVIAESAAGAGDGGSILLKATLDDNNETGLEKIVFADGTTWTKANLRLMLLDQATTTGSDTITGFNVADVIDARAGNDTINAGDGADTITGGLGNDVINGGKANDTYYYSRGDGNDTITEDVWGGTNDQLVLSGINSGDVTLVRNGNDVTLVIAESTPGAGDGGSILLKASLDDNNETGLEKIVFADGTTWTKANLRLMLLGQATTAGNDTITGFNVADVIDARAGNDTINAGDGADTITGGLGNDVINGGKANDTYYYNRGDGNDTITEDVWGGTSDQLVLSGINSGDVTLVRNGNDVTLVIAESAAGAGDGGSILLKATLDDNNETGLEKIVFADGTTWTKANLRLMLLGQATTAGNDTITGFNVADVIDARAGNDTINAGDGADTITGGLGSDVINGGKANDTYYYSRGDGNDTIAEDVWGGTNDQLVLSGVNPGAVTLVRNGNDVTLVIAESTPGAGDGGSILLKASLDDNNETGLEKIVFADGTTWTKANLRLMLLDQATTTGSDTISGFNVADVIDARAGNDTINAGDGTDTITGGLGNDVINGGKANDTYYYSRGDGNDTITEDVWGGSNDQLVLSGINSGNVALVRNGNDVTLVIAESAAGAGDGGSLLLKAVLDGNNETGLEKIVFADGTIWTRAQMVANIAYVGGTVGTDTITGTSGSDQIRAGGGNDQLVGLAGNDTYVYSQGDGNDIVDEQTTGTDVDALLLGNLAQTQVQFEWPSGALNDVVIRILATGDTITLKNQFDQEGGIEKIVFADGSVLGGDDWSLDGILTNVARLAGTDGNETITGYAGKNDVIVGKGGNDTLQGLTGDDRFIFTPNFGKDVITDFTAGAGSGDVLEFDNSLFANFEAALTEASQVGSDTVITFDANNTITLKNVVKSNLHMDDFSFMVV